MLSNKKRTSKTGINDDDLVPLGSNNVRKKPGLNNNNSNSNHDDYSNEHTAKKLKIETPPQLIPTTTAPPVLSHSQPFHQHQQQQQQANGLFQSGNQFHYNIIVDLVNSATEIEKKVKIIKTLIQSMKNSTGEPDKNAYVSLLVLAKTNDNIFTHPELLEPLLTLLSSKSSMQSTPKRNNHMSLLACNLLMTGYDAISQWPIQFFQVYIEDAITDRHWVDDSNAKYFVSNILASIPSNKLQPATNNINTSTTTITNTTTNTSTSSLSSPTPSNVNKATTISAPILGNKNLTPTKLTTPTTTATTSNIQSAISIEDENMLNEELDQISSIFSIKKSRFSNIQNELVEYIRAAIKANQNNPKSLLKLLNITVGFKESRADGSGSLEGLFNNSTFFRSVKEYIQTLIANSTESTPEDIRVVQNLLKLPNVDTITSLLPNNPIYPVIALRYAIETEVEAPSTSHAKSNMASKSKLATIFKSLPPSRGEEELANILKEYAAKEDQKLPARLLARKILKSLPFLNISYFCEQILSISTLKESSLIEASPVQKERWAINLLQMVCQILLLIPSTVPMDSKDNQNNTRNMLSVIQSASVNWCGHLLPDIVSSPDIVIDLISRVLFFEPIGSYSQMAGPGQTPQQQQAAQQILETDRTAYRILTTETPIQEVVIQILLNIASDHPKRKEILDMIDILLKRAISVSTKLMLYSPLNKPTFGEQIILLSKIDTFDQVPTKLSFPNLFWQSTILVCLLVCISPTNVGSGVWTQFPTIKLLIEMIITKNWKFPPYISKYLQSTNQYQFYQNHEASQRFKEVELSSSLNCDVMILDLKGVAREPPIDVIERLQKLDNDYHLGFILCNCRSPDYLLDIMSNQDSRQSMGWLNPIIHNDPKTLDILPPICISEILLSLQNFDLNLPNNPNSFLLNRVLSRITFFFNSLSPLPTLEILNFFFTLLYSPVAFTRTLSKKALLILSNSLNTTNKTGLNTSQLEESFQWLLKLNELNWFEDSHDIIISSLIQSLLIETDIKTIKAYLQYLYSIFDASKDSSFILELSQFLLNRQIISKFTLSKPDISRIILAIFETTLRKSPSPSIYSKSYNSIKWFVIKPNNPEKSKIQIPKPMFDSIIFTLSYSNGDNKENEQLINSIQDFIFTDIESYQYDNQQVTLSELLSNEQCKLILMSPSRILIEISISKLSVEELKSKLFSTEISIQSRLIILEKLNSNFSSDDFKSLDKLKIEILKDLLTKVEKDREESFKNIKLFIGQYSNQQTPVHNNSQFNLLNQFYKVKNTNDKMNIDIKSNSNSNSNLIKTSIEIVTNNSSRNNLAEFLKLINNSTCSTNNLFYECILKFLKANQRDPKDISIQNQIDSTLESFRSKSQKTAISSKQNQLSESKLIVQELLKLLEYGTSSGEFLFFKFIRFLNTGSDTSPVLLFNCLLELLDKLDDKSAPKNNSNMFGLILDSIVLLINQFSFQKQTSLDLNRIYFLVFGGNYETKIGRYQTLLLSHLIHTSNWKNLSFIASWLLSEENREITVQLNPSLVMTFFTAYFQHPRSSTPHLKASNSSTPSTRSSSTSSFMLPSSMRVVTPNTIRLLSEYITRESKQLGNTQSLSLRMPIISASCKSNREVLVSLVNYLTHQSTPDNQYTLEMMRLVYYSFPSTVKEIIPIYTPNIDMKKLALQSPPLTQLDVILHRVILKFGDFSTTGGGNSISFIMIRKLALIHPELVCLHLSSLYSLTAGRSLIPIDQFIQRMYHHIFYQLLDLIHILLPFVFNSPFLQKIINEYIQFFTNFTESTKNTDLFIINEIQLLAYKFIDFIVLEENFNLQIQHKDLIRSLSKIYPILKMITQKSIINTNSNILKILPSNFHLKVQNQSNQSNQSHPNNYLLQLSNLTNDKSIALDQIQDNNVKLLNLLEDIDKKTCTDPKPLTLVVGQLLELLQSNHSNVRSISYYLIQRYLYNNPQGCTNEVLEKYLECFKSPNPEILKDAIEHCNNFYCYSTLSNTSNHLIQLLLLYNNSFKSQTTLELKKIITPYIKIFQ